MRSSGREPAVLIAKYPIHGRLAPFPVACLVGVLLTDVTYWRTAEIMWADFSAWLVSAGVILGYLVAIVALSDLLTGRLARAEAPVWPYIAGGLVVLTLATLNTLVHTRDAWTSVVPWGLVLSAATVLILLVTAWVGRSLFDKHNAAAVGDVVFTP